MFTNPRSPIRRTRPTRTQRDEGWFTVLTAVPGRANVRRDAIDESLGLR